MAQTTFIGVELGRIASLCNLAFANVETLLVIFIQGGVANAYSPECANRMGLALGPRHLAIFIGLPLYYKYDIIIEGAAMLFERDARKAESNRQKHGVSFEDAREVFDDYWARIIPDPEHSVGEDRFIILGLSLKASVLVVCHCCRKDSEAIRIISARRATKRERDTYWRLRQLKKSTTSANRRRTHTLSVNAAK